MTSSRRDERRDPITVRNGLGLVLLLICTASACCGTRVDETDSTRSALGTREGATVIGIGGAGTTAPTGGPSPGEESNAPSSGGSAGSGGAGGMGRPVAEGGAGGTLSDAGSGGAPSPGAGGTAGQAGSGVATGSAGASAGGPAKLGDPCDAKTACPAGGSGTAVCVTDWPSGYCAVDGCAAHGHDCPDDPGEAGDATSGGKCVSAPTPMCLALCASAANCRPGYDCVPRPDAAGHGDYNVCAPSSGWAARGTAAPGR